MTWRERIVAARERGTFTEDDIRQAHCPDMCAVGEAMQPLGKPHPYTYFSQMAGLWRWKDQSDCNAGGMFPVFVEGHRFDEAEACLNWIEDRVLQLKRKAHP